MKPRRRLPRLAIDVRTPPAGMQGKRVQSQTQASAQSAAPWMSQSEGASKAKSMIMLSKATAKQANFSRDDHVNPKDCEPFYSHMLFASEMFPTYLRTRAKVKIRQGKAKQQNSASPHKPQPPARRDSAIRNTYWRRSVGAGFVNPSDATELEPDHYVEAEIVKSPKKAVPISEIPEEWQVLVEIRESTGFHMWTKNRSGWIELEMHRDPGLCDGIDVDSATGRITRIDLRSTGLEGTVYEYSCTG